MTPEQIAKIREFAEFWRDAAREAARCSDRWGDEVNEAVQHIDALLAEVTAAWAYIESHHLAARDESEYEITNAVAKAMRGIVGVHPEVCTRVFAAIEPMFSAYRNARMEVERLGSALGRTGKHQLNDCGCRHEGAQHETVLVCPSCMPTFAVVPRYE
jgi:hypothetical protein